MGRPIETLIRLAVVNIAILSVAYVAAAVAASQALAGCDEWCGDLQIPYPFGTREGCYLNEDFFINCNKTHYDPPKAFLGSGNLNVTNISISGEFQILHFMAQDCYPRNNALDNSASAFLNLAYHTVSSTKNKFIVIGCDTFSFIRGVFEGQTYRTACVALCDDITTVRDGRCSGNGCCQLEIPNGLTNIEYEVSSFNNHVNVSSFNPCGYAFLIEEDRFNFSSKYIRNFPQQRIPLVVDWAIANSTCSAAENKTNCICGPNSRKVDFLPDGSKYRCQCLEGFEGNPYLSQGCQGKRSVIAEIK